jgi:tetratricopeptide (TPR) repeat protein
MRKLFDQLLGALRQFLKQRDHLLLLVPCEDSDVALLLKALRDLDRESGADVFLLFAEDFRAPDTFLNDIAQRLQEEHALTNEAVGPDVPKLPPLPAAFLDQHNPPPARLEAGLRYGHSLIDPRQGQHFLWGMAPGMIGDPKSYLELLAQLLPNPDIRPWMRGARIVARAPADFQLDGSPLALANRVQVQPFTIPPNAQEEELAAAADDPKVPLGDRMQAEVQLAYLDYAHSRFDQAIERFLKALAFFQWAEIPAMEGLIICGLGDIARRQENWQEAQHWYACAVEPTAKAGNPILMSNIVHNLAVVAFQEKRFSDAEERYSELVTLKRAMIDEDGLAEALEWQGLSQEQQGAYDRAVVCWEESALICKAFELTHRLGPMLTHLRRGYQALEMHEELETFDEEWNA